MAKLKSPLLSLGASGQLGKSIVFTPWKGLDNVREYVIPANPRTSGQNTQRGYFTAAVALVHTAQGLAADPLAAADISAYGLLASTFKSAQTWFNEAVRQFVNQRVAAVFGAIYRDGSTTPGVGTLAVSVARTKDTGSANDITAGSFYYGTSKTALVNVEAAVVAAGVATGTIAALTAGVKYYWQFRASAHVDFLGTKSGIYYGTPT